MMTIRNLLLGGSGQPAGQPVAGQLPAAGPVATQPVAPVVTTQAQIPQVVTQQTVPSPIGGIFPGMNEPAIPSPMATVFPGTGITVSKGPDFVLIII